MSRMQKKLLAIGLVLGVLAGLHWIWLASTGRETTTALGGLTGAVLVILFALVWAAIDKNKS